MNDDDVRDDDEDEPTDDLVAEAVDLEIQNRLWVRTLIPLLQLRKGDSDPSPRVQLALDLATIAACERIGRICRSDVSIGQ